MITFSREQGIALREAGGTVLVGWALAEQGQDEKGFAQIQQGLSKWQETGARLSQAYHLSLLAEAHGKAGRVEEGLMVLAEALAIVDEAGDRFYEAELWRLKGELLLQRPRVRTMQKNE